MASPIPPIGRALIARGRAAAREHVAAGIRAWLKANPGNGAQVMEIDKSFVFFQESPVGDAALGAGAPKACR